MCMRVRKAPTRVCSAPVRMHTHAADEAVGRRLRALVEEKLRPWL